MSRSTDTLSATAIQNSIGSGVLGRRVHFYRSLESTNTTAAKLASEGAAEGTMVLAETQTKGRGRLGRVWISPPGVNLYASVVLLPQIPPYDAPKLTLVMATAVAVAIRKMINLPVLLKWPNDIMLGGKKVGGMLTEMHTEGDRIQHVIVGLGLNVNVEPATFPPEVGAIAGSLKAALGRDISRNDLMVAILHEMEHWYCRFLQEGMQPIHETWETFSDTIGQRVRITLLDHVLEGIARGLDNDGRLLVERDDGTVSTIHVGDVTVVRKVHGELGESHAAGH